ncbi:sugar phosphate isomerase/epimerase family protein [Pelagicoccus sp. SDUM812002]|uniref:sugar phosphate isomerase/epimerase family protein n=1 Tax=Pelagicoccus sp. SDUM812002 TaxID=3041266 RepID=UPI00280D1C19|nr:sugar phosphate isomerase/epimerase family protein [Pelagicoccus sp. SDUM812002]MDQ8185164.1 sugar phosphate isomerase/epimerase [Pelagicoccus sp. SDUM812002]
MKFGASTWLWTSPFDGSDVSLLHKIAEQGFDCVEIPVEDPDAMDAQSIATALKVTGLEAIVCAAVVGDRDLSSAEPRKVQAAEAYLEACIKLAVTWGSSLVVGPLYAPVAKQRLPTEAERQEEWSRSATGLRRMASVAQGSGVRLGIEPLNRFESDMVNTAADALRMLDEIDHPAIGLSLDSFHMNIEEVDFCKAIERAGKRLLHLQVSDSHRGVPGEGNSDWTGLREGLRRIGYEAAVSIESFSPDSSSLAEAVCIWKRFAASQDEFARKGLQFLKEWSA